MEEDDPARKRGSVATAGHLRAEDAALKPGADPGRATRERIASRKTGNDPHMAQGDVHVVRAVSGWRVQVEGVARARSTYATQAEAAITAREVARRNKRELLIHGRDGRIRVSSTYGEDPRHTKS
jgi:Uncharacterized protein conserved in bacteria (DUF2188)